MADRPAASCLRLPDNSAERRDATREWRVETANPLKTSLPLRSGGSGHLFGDSGGAVTAANAPANGLRHQRDRAVGRRRRYLGPSCHRALPGPNSPAGSSRISRCRHVRLSSPSWDNPDLRIWGTRCATEELNFCIGCVNWFTLAHPHPAHSEVGGPSYVQHP
jgi:hypothetical protein